MENKEFEKSEKERLDKLNNKRAVDTKIAVARALRGTEYMSDRWNGHDSEAADVEQCMKDSDELATVIGKLDRASEEMQWACQHYDWNDDIVYLINDAIAYFGDALAMLVLAEDDDFDGIVVSSNLSDGRIKLAKALATLTVWFND